MRRPRGGDTESRRPKASVGGSVSPARCSEVLEAAPGVEEDDALGRIEKTLSEKILRPRPDGAAFGRGEEAFGRADLVAGATHGVVADRNRRTARGPDVAQDQVIGEGLGHPQARGIRARV